MKKVTIFILIVAWFGAPSQEIGEHEVNLGLLSGTLSMPKNPSEKAILLISGSGPTDRDGNSSLGFTNNSLKMLAVELTKAGYVVLRYDKRGIAGSKEAVTGPSSIRFDDFVEDAQLWLQFLAEKGYQEVIVIGHSQGSLTGMIAVQQNKSVLAFISIAGLGTDAGEAIVRQLVQQAPVLADEARISIDSIRQGHQVKKYNPFLISLFNPQIQDFLRSYMAYDPLVEIKKLDIPILIINGTTDLQVTTSDAKALSESSQNADLLIIEEMNHVLKHADTGDLVANSGSYNNPDLPLADGLVTGIVEFIKKL